MEQEKQSSLIDFDIGVGTPYERWSLWNLFDWFIDDKNVKSFIELPKDGMTGIKGLNSLYIASRGVKTTLFLTDPQEIELIKKIANSEHIKIDVRKYEGIESLKSLPSKSYDLAWSFNGVIQFDNMEEQIGEMSRLAKKYLLFSCSNKLNYGYFAHVLHHKKMKLEWDHGDMDKMDLGKITRIAKKYSARPIKKLAIDVPWWPDIDLPAEQVIGDLVPILKKPLAKSSSKEARLKEFHFKWNNLPYFERSKYNELKNKLKKHSFLERYLPYHLKVIFAHHRAKLFELKQSR